MNSGGTHQNESTPLASLAAFQRGTTAEGSSTLLTVSHGGSTSQAPDIGAILDAFRAEIEAQGLRPVKISADGSLSRCPVEGKPQRKDGAYILHMDHPASGWWQNHCTDESGTWTAMAVKELTEQDRRILHERIEQDQTERKAEEARKHAEAAIKARDILDAAPDCPPDHSYLTAKAVPPCPGLKLDTNGRIIVPLLDSEGKLSSLQFIGADGTKRFLPDGKKKGSYFLIKGDDGPLHIAEGYATAASIHEATGGTVLVAFDAGNLLPVAEQARQRYPEREITVCGDDDHQTKGNPGRTKATAAALAVNGKLALPVFQGRGGTDFNDLAQAEGLEAVRKQISEASNPGAEPDPLRRPFTEATDYPLECLHPFLAPAGEKIAESVQAPKAMCGQSVLAAAALAVQPFADVEIDGRRFPISCFFITVGESGERKSAVDALALKAHREFERELEDRHADEIRQHQAEMTAYKMGREAVIKKNRSIQENRDALLALGPEPEPPLIPMMMCEEPTLEGMQKLLFYGQPGIGVISDEGGRMIGGHGMNQDNRLKTAAGLSALWDGSRFSRVRAGEGAASARGRRVTMHLMIQPSIAQALLSDQQLLDQGLLSRCLVSWPESTAGQRQYRAMDLNRCPEVLNYWRRIDDILHTPKPLAEGKRNELEPRTLTLAPEAKRLWTAFHDHVETRLGEGGQFAPIRGFANKAAEHAARLAGVLTLVEDLNAPNIPIRHMQSGLELTNHYLTESLRLFNAGATDPDLELAEQVLEWARKQGRHVALPTIYTFGPSRIRNKKEAERIVRALEQHGWFKRVAGGMEIDGKHRKDVWEVVG